MNKRIWTLKQDSYILENYGKIQITKLAKDLDCSVGALINRLNSLGIKYEIKEIKRWSMEEEEFLRNNANKYIVKTLAKKLNRSEQSIIHKAKKMGITIHCEVDIWKPWMIAYLKDNINKKPLSEICRFLGLSNRRVLTKCSELGIVHIPEKNGRWTKEEIEILKKYASTCHFTELTKVLPGRSVGSISYKIHDLGIESISEYVKLENSNSKTVKYIKANWGKKPIREIARDLELSTSVIYRYKKKLNLPNTGQLSKKWTKEVIKKLELDAKTMTRSELAKKYKTSPEQITKLAYNNNIKLIDSKKIWNDSLDKQLIELSKQNLSVGQIANIMKLKAATIRSRSKKLGIYESLPKYPNRVKWTMEEVSLLKELVKTKTTEEIANILNKREDEVYLKIKKLKIRVVDSNRNNWSKDEIDKLLELYRKLDLDILSKELGRSETTIREKAKQLGISLKYKPKTNWSKEEEELLEDLAKDYTLKEILAFFNRTQSSIASKLRVMGIKAQTSSKFWTEDEEKRLIELYDANTIQEIAKIMNKPYRAVIAKLYTLGLKVVNPKTRNWTKEEEERLFELLDNYSSFEVSEILNRSEESIITRATKLGYNFEYKQRKWTEEEEEELQELWGKSSLSYIAKKLDRTESSVLNRARVLHLGSQISNNYDGLTIKEISEIFKISRNAISTTWIDLGLKVKTRSISKYRRYRYVTIEDLLEFLEKYQDNWDSKNLEKNIFGEEPNWLIEKRKKDINKPPYSTNMNDRRKQQLIMAKKYYLEQSEKEEEKPKVKKLGCKEK